MKLLLSFFTSIILVFIISLTAKGQVNYSSNVSHRMDVSGGKMFIYYNIPVERESKFFDVELKVVKDGKRLIVNSLKGDCCSPIAAGLKKMMEWEWAKDYHGEIEGAEIDVIATLIPGPSAGFEIVSDITYAPAEVAFRNTSLNADGYIWIFDDPDSGDDNKSSNKDTVHVFNNPGNYVVTLTAINNLYESIDLEKKTIAIEIPPDPPKASYEIENEGDSFEAPATIVFKNMSENSDKVSWDFGDPESLEENVSVDENPSHTFTKPSKYTVELKSTNSETGMHDTESKVITVIEAGIKPSANFEYDPGTIKPPPVQVWFKNTSKGGKEYQWDFDDPDSGKKQFSQGKSPTHVFKKSGPYKVKLTVTNQKSGKSDVKVISIEIPEESKFPF